MVLESMTYIYTTHDCQGNGYEQDHQGDNSHCCLAAVVEVDEFLPLVDWSHQEERAMRRKKCVHEERYWKSAAFKEQQSAHSQHEKKG